jgi:molybdopterin molybdotransferase
MLTVREAHARVIAAFAPLPAEIVSIADAVGRVLAKPPAARLTQPPADLSAMDGYAVRAADIPAAPTTLTLVGQAPAGGSYDHALKPGEAVRIFTGAALPMGADSIVIQEDTKADGTKITILEAPTPGRLVRKAGLD